MTLHIYLTLLFFSLLHFTFFCKWIAFRFSNLHFTQSNKRMRFEPQTDPEPEQMKCHSNCVCEFCESKTLGLTSSCLAGIHPFTISSQSESFIISHWCCHYCCLNKEFINTKQYVCVNISLSDETTMLLSIVTIILWFTFSIILNIQMSYTRADVICFLLLRLCFCSIFDLIWFKSFI